MKTRSWIVTLECVVTKEIITHECTHAKAHDEPFEVADYENETDQREWKVISVEPNE